MRLVLLLFAFTLLSHSAVAQGEPSGARLVALRMSLSRGVLTRAERAFAVSIDDNVRGDSSAPDEARRQEALALARELGGGAIARRARDVMSCNHSCEPRTEIPVLIVRDPRAKGGRLVVEIEWYGRAQSAQGTRTMGQLIEVEVALESGRWRALGIVSAVSGTSAPTRP